MTLNLQKHSDGYKTVYFWRLKVKSNIKYGLYKFKDLPITASDELVMNTAGALAEMICEQYGDNLDPDQYAREAKTLCDPMRQAMAKHFRPGSGDQLKVEAD